MAQQGAIGEPRAIELEAHPSLQLLQAGEPVYNIPVVPGETVIFRVDNTSGFEHNFYIGTEQQLAVPDGVTDVGIPGWWNGVQELVWTVPDDIDGLIFGCTTPGHIYLEHGFLSEARALPDGGVERLPGPEPTEPTFDVQQGQKAPADPLEDVPGGRAELPWARMALTLPSTWVYEVDPAPPDEWDTMTVLFAYPSAPGPWSECSVDVARERRFSTGPVTAEEAEERGWEWAQAPLSIGGEPATRTDWTVDETWLDYVIHVSRYDVTAPYGWHYSITCNADELGNARPALPTDRWLSIAETFEFLPASE